MRKRYWGIIIAALLIIFILLFLVINLSNKNHQLGFISDEYRQTEVLQKIYTQMLDQELKEGKVILEKDPSVYINFITYNHYVISQENLLNDFFSKYTQENAKQTYTLSNAYDLKNSTLNITLSSNDNANKVIYTYKLDINKKDSKIKYNLVKIDRIDG